VGKLGSHLVSTSLVVAGVFVAVACTHTVFGTGPAEDAGAAAPSPEGCPDIAGDWIVKGGLRNCPASTCAIVQAQCSLTLTCENGTYTGTVNGSLVTWHNDTLTCSGTAAAAVAAVVGPGHLQIDGSCTGAGGLSCTLAMTR
jgi:hypothetical protein